MLNDIIIGLGIGFVMSFGFGIVFFSLFEKSLHLSIRKVITFIVGLQLADTLIFWASPFVTRLLALMPYFNIVFNVIGACFLFLAAYHKVYRGISFQKTEAPSAKGHFLLEGFLLNLLNPANVLSWLFISEFYLQKSSSMGLTFAIFIVSNFIFLILIHQLVASNKKRFPMAIITSFNYVNAAIFCLAGFKILYALEIQ